LRVARVQIDEMATPVLGLRADGGLYEVEALEAAWGIQTPFSGRGFHTRIATGRGEGLDELAARLHASKKPRAARLARGSYLPLAPCDTDRASHVQLAPRQTAASDWAWQQREARSMVGDGQPVGVFGDALRLEIGLAVVLCDDLWQAEPGEVERAIAGFTLLFDWHGRDPGWRGGACVPASPCQLGPELVMRRRLRDVSELQLRIDIGGRSIDAAPLSAGKGPPTQALAYLSHHVPLRAGDVVGLGAHEGACLTDVAFGQKVRARLHPLLSLEGWAAPAPSPSS
jgi:Fumarylacetoacetate (FAA) hydrolase family